MKPVIRNGLSKFKSKPVRILCKTKGDAPGTLRRKEAALGYILVTPSVLLLVTLYLFPLVSTLLISILPSTAVVEIFDAFRFENLSLLTFDNYTRSIKDSIWNNSIGNTAILMSIVVVVGLPLSLGIAIVLNEQFVGRGLLRGLLLVPWAIPPVVNGTIWNLILHGDVGTLNGVLYELGFISKYVIWLGEPTLALVTVSLAVAWRWLPFMTLLLLAGLQTIPDEIYEAAKVDGAKAWQRFWYVTLPSIRSVLLTVAIIQAIWTTKMFAEFYTLTQGGPSYSTTVMYHWIYKQGFEFLRLGYASALAYILGIFTSILIVIYYFLSLRRNEE
jgi:multiple sugar transport system permease protein